MSKIAQANTSESTRATFGSVSVTPTGNVVVGTYHTWTICYTVGSYGMDVGGGLKIGTRRQADFGTPQFEEPQAANYVGVKCSTASALRTRFDPRGHMRPFRAVIVVDLANGPLYPGDTITVVLGDTSVGSPGMVVQSFPEEQCEFAVFVDPISSGVYKRVYQETPFIRVVPGVSQQLTLQAPSTVIVGQPFRVQVRGNDKFGNPTAVNAGKLVLDSEPPVHFSLAEGDGRAKWLENVKLSSAGVRRLTLRAGAEVLATSNPIAVRPTQERYQLYWGDTQAQTATTVGIGTVEEYYRFARDLAGLDFITHQGNDFMLSDADVDEVRRETKEFHRPHHFIPFFGYEWSGATGTGGDRNVLYLDDDGPIYRSSGWQLEADEYDPTSERVSAKQAQDAFRKLVKQQGERVLLVPHIGGRRSDIAVQDAELEPVFEICSCHGIFEWRLHEALARGLKLGVLGASDDHTGRPGLAFPSTPEMTIRGGLGAVLATELTRESLFEALKARRCYATTGARILLDVRAAGHPMGTAFDADTPPRITANVHGTAPLEEICLFNGARELLRLTPNTPQRDVRRIRILWRGANSPDRGRFMSWDGALQLNEGRILSATPLNMFTAKYGIVESEVHRLAWRSVTAGQEEGVLIEVDAPDQARIDFAAGPARFSFALGEVRTNDINLSFGGLEQAVRATTLHAVGDDTDATLDFVERDLAPGDHAYFVRVVQSDFHRAWSSPIYVKKR
jgi:Protein of unknown function (DUF3604)